MSQKRLETQLTDGPCVVEFPIVNWSQNWQYCVQDKENLLPMKGSNEPLKMLEKEEYLENMAEKLSIDQVIGRSRDLWQNSSVEQLKCRRPVSQGGLTGRTTKRSSRTSLK